MKNPTVFLILSVLFFSIDGLAQGAGSGIVPVLKTAVRYDGSEKFTVGEVNGTVKTKAVYLPKPLYPDEARRAGVEGTVRVQISIDEQGNVTNAVSLSGSVLLTGVAEGAARRSKFRILRDTTGQAIKAAGVMVYSFEIKKAGWSKIGYDLNLLKQMPVSMISIPAISKAIDPGWTIEKELFAKLEEIRQGAPDPPEKPFPVFVSSGVNKYPNEIAVQSQTMVVTPPQRATPDQAVIVQNLISGLRGRLANDELSSWQFDLGLNLGDAFQSYRDPRQRGEAARIVTGFIEIRPKSASVEVLEALQSLLVNFGKESRSVNNADEILRAMNLIFKAK